MSICSSQKHKYQHSKIQNQRTIPTAYPDSQQLQLQSRALLAQYLPYSSKYYCRVIREFKRYISRLRNKICGLSVRDAVNIGFPKELEMTVLEFTQHDESVCPSQNPNFASLTHMCWSKSKKSPAVLIKRR